jgi:hypothetical protein
LLLQLLLLLLLLLLLMLPTTVVMCWTTHLERSIVMAVQSIPQTPYK